jgi:hypothetical protein
MTEFLHPRSAKAARTYSEDDRSTALVDADLRVQRLLNEGDPSDEAGLILLLNTRIGVGLAEAAELIGDASSDRHARLRLIEQLAAAFLSEVRPALI